MRILHTPQLRVPATAVFILAIALCAFELIAISIAYRDQSVFACRDLAPRVFCTFTDDLAARGIGIVAMLGLLVIARSGVCKLSRKGLDGSSAGLLLNGLGFGAILLPIFLSDTRGVAFSELITISMWAIGGALMLGGVLILAAPIPVWRVFLRRYGATLGVLVGIGAFLPDLVEILRSLPLFETVTSLTSSAANDVLAVIGYADVSRNHADASAQGMAIASIIIAAYILLFRADLRFPHVFLLLPLGIALTWILTLTSIVPAALAGGPEGSAHSGQLLDANTGWFIFASLALGLVMASRAQSFFKPKRSARSTPLLHSPATAQILPFAAFALIGLLAPLVLTSPAVTYPLQVAAVAVAFALVGPYLKSLPWRLDAVAIFAGVATGMMWVTIVPSAEPAFLNIPAPDELRALWLVLGACGTLVLIPIAQELMFRGYILNRIAAENAPLSRVCIALFISTGLFAILHENWIAAAIAGLVFGLLAVRSRNIADAIVGHVTASTSMFLWAYATGDWHII